MPDTPDRCEPPEALRGVDGVHWIRHGAARPTLAMWHPEARVNYPSYLRPGWWEFGSNHLDATDAYGWGYRYLSPVPTPAEIAALVRAGRRFQSYNCPICNGDCAGANPPIIGCPMQDLSTALAAPSFKEIE